MHWIEGVTREKAKLVLLTRNSAGELVTNPLSALGELPKPAGKFLKSKFDTDFQRWELSPATEYLSGISFPFPVPNTQSVFKFIHQQVTYLIPAHVLFKAIFRPLGLMAPYLFKPHGMEQTCVPTLERVGVNFVMPGLSKRTQSCSSLQQPLSWLWCFPSARRTWDSVYDYACQGLLGCDLPHGNARIVVTGIKKDVTFCVTEMTILQVTTDEFPFEFALGHTQTIVFHEGISFRQRQRSDFTAAADRTIKQINHQWDLTDLEWEAIYPLFSEQEKRGIAKRKHELRILLNGIIAKLGTGIPWTKYKFPTGTWSNASKLYGECRKDGRWKQIQLILDSSRATSP